MFDDFWLLKIKKYVQTDFQIFAGTNFSTFYHNGEEVLQKNPLDPESSWATKDGKIEIPCEEVADNMAQIGEELTLLQMSKKLRHD